MIRELKTARVHLSRIGVQARYDATRDCAGLPWEFFSAEDSKMAANAEQKFQNGTGNFGLREIPGARPTQGHGARIMGRKKSKKSAADLRR
jgi:hypothetical protein